MTNMDGYTIISNPDPPHACQPQGRPDRSIQLGAIVECDQCKKRWRLNEFHGQWESVIDTSWVTTETIEKPRRHWWNR